MPTWGKLEKAELQEISWTSSGRSKIENPSRKLVVQFNPETLTISFSAATGQKGRPASQFSGETTETLSCELWFDVTASMLETARDVRTLTQKVAYFITPQIDKTDEKKKKKIIPGVRFLWGSLLFEGVMTSMTETIDFFSKEGIPLRAKVNMSIKSVKQIEEDTIPASPTVTPMTNPVGEAVQKAALALAVGIRAWRAVAELNDIENPRLMKPGELLKLPMKR